MNKNNNDTTICGCKTIHNDIIEKVDAKMPKEDVFTKLGVFFKAFGDPTRLKILHALLISEMCVCDIAALLNMNQSAISHQLRILKINRLVKFRKEGKVVYYSLDDKHIGEIFESGFAHISE